MFYLCSDVDVQEEPSFWEKANRMEMSAKKRIQNSTLTQKEDLKTNGKP
jgi:hypothetical protein